MGLLRFFSRNKTPDPVVDAPTAQLKLPIEFHFNVSLTAEQQQALGFLLSEGFTEQVRVTIDADGKVVFSEEAAIGEDARLDGWLLSTKNVHAAVCNALERLFPREKFSVPLEGEELDALEKMVMPFGDRILAAINLLASQRQNQVHALLNSGPVLPSEDDSGDWAGSHRTRNPESEAIELNE